MWCETSPARFCCCLLTPSIYLDLSISISLSRYLYLDLTKAIDEAADDRFLDRDASILSRREASAPPPLRPLHLNSAESSSKSAPTASGGVSDTYAGACTSDTTPKASRDLSGCCGSGAGSARWTKASNERMWKHQHQHQTHKKTF